MPDIIKEFRGQHRFLSNFFPSPMRVRNMGTPKPFIAPTAEHVFQAMKTRNADEQHSVLEQDTPGRAKRAGRKVTLRDDWEDIKLNVMRMVVEAKFEQNSDLLTKLIATGDTWLEEGNHWNDTFWGVDIETGKGENHLGLILMETREKLK